MSHGATKDMPEPVAGNAWKPFGELTGLEYPCYLWYFNPAWRRSPEACRISEDEDSMGDKFSILRLRGGSWDLLGFVESNPSGLWAHCIPPKI